MSIFDVFKKNHSLQDDWKQWDEVHDNPDQKKRLSSSKKAENTPLSINQQSGTGEFSGSHGKYKTSLSSCTCVDFARRKKPCKHMYRLAIELGMMEESTETDAKKVKEPKPKDAYTLEEAIAKLSTLSIASQKLMLRYFSFTCNSPQKEVPLQKGDDLNALLDADFLRVADNPNLINWLHIYTRTELNNRIIEYFPELKFKKNMSRDDLCNWIAENIKNPQGTVCHDTTPVIYSPKLIGIQKSLHHHLRSLYDPDLWYDPESGEFRTVELGEKSTTIEVKIR